MFKGFKAIARGESHKEKDLPCQDAVFFKPYRNGGIIAVADGHGSEKHFRSDSGSEFAVNIAHSTIYEFNTILRNEMKGKGKNHAAAARFSAASAKEEQMKQVERTIISRWRAEVIKHYRDHPLSDGERELCARLNLDSDQENTQVRFYGTTLLAALLKDSFWFVIQIGDGKCVIIDGRKKASFLPALDNEALGFGKTTSLCDSNAVENFRHVYGDTPIKGITLATDGVSDSFLPDAYLEFHERFYADFRADPNRASEGVEKGIGVWAAAGSRDDAAMAGILRV
ncbi:MAG: protein phosphatase 2C domain-containing protein [Treponema sp.]|jgi:hypothetical protein|nr:protein phosphatase 2C domain-containing protein [Treponema sp.]